MFMEIFQEEGKGQVTSIDTVYEKSKSDDFYKLVISAHGLLMEDLFIIHTKFIFKTDKNKINLIDNSFIYLYDINCIYHKVNFKSVLDLKSKISSIINSSNFGEDIKILSDFIASPAMFLNYYLKREKITDYSIFDVLYNPKFKIQPCHKTTFDFIINVNNNYKIELSIKKREKQEDDETDIYIFRFKFLDKMIIEKSDTLYNIHFFVGYNLAKILDEKLK